ncbi:MAG TPA: sigma-70 family RNA polymerase sigma factor [Thermoanaerobaculia bacterium]|nr:sigma-70 family RNA polymerase sigma factor [Thermoanaerobaculia bacterium]
METKELGDDFSSDHDIERQDFVQLWQRHHNELYGLCLHWMGGHHADAEEALGNASIAALVKFKEIGASLRNPRAWLNRLCRNACMDLYRQRQRQRELASMELEDLESAGSLSGAVIPRTPQQSCLDRELSSFVRQAIIALPPRLRVPMVLRFFLQKPYREVADELGITEENVRKRIQQAREILRARLVDYKAGRSELAVDPAPALAPEEEKSPPYLGSGTGGPEPGRLAAPGGVPRAIRVQMCGGREKTFVLFLERREGRRPAAKVPALSRYVQKHPGGWKKRLELAEALFLAGRWEEAVAQYRLVLLKKPLLLEVWTRLGDLLRRMGRNQEAEEAFGAALTVVRGEAARRHVQGWIEVCRRRFSVAGEAFAEAAVLEPTNPAHGLALAAVHLEEDRTAEAIEALEDVLARDPDNLPALLASHEALWTAGRQSEAACRALHALEVDPDNFVAAQRVAELRLRRGLVHGAEGRETRRLLARVLRLAPEWPDGWAAMACLHARQGRPAKAEALLHAYVQEHPFDARGWTLLARLLAGNGDLAAAADAALRSLDLEEEPGAQLEARKALRDLRADES